ncbi:alpha-1,2-fucosyltransferase [Polaribacter vadi]|uniref:alpha-1,2-fucosyltransferase n=1 Tax=Polaribacter TaxID=52959 RepID=UPI001C0A4A49|nr:MULTISPECIES: alpha-1,2-fucosyltransferase [Polaribacter]MBU3010021.1 alpha-1,2-fucosyltransferase [Polaribacter vadi]MDO6739828.1 alpha-1,2-fucosyltransferase [Polaribacter sp. 1_MG-2023]
MIIVRIVGGLGNQMFQYAYAKSLQQKGFDVQIDISKFKTYKLHGGYQLDKYNIDLEIADTFTTFLGKIKIKKNVREKSLLFDENLFSLNGNEYVKGYYQTEKYFKYIRSILINQFVIQQKLSESTLVYANEIFKFSNSCAVHIRRGDYISDKKANNIHGTCDLDYYHKAIDIIKEKHKNAHFFVFSDDIAWTKENLNIENSTYINNKTIPHEDLYLMSLCKNNITANSSFSWWGAWLNQNENKTVISPKKWFNDKENEVACKKWIKL